MTFSFHMLCGEKVCKKVAGDHRRHSENIFQYLMWGSLALSWEGFCKFCKQNRFWWFGVFFLPIYMSLVLVKVSPGSETCHGYCAEGKAGEAVQRRLLQQRLGYKEHIF